MTQWIHNIIGPQALFVNFFGATPLSSPHSSCPVLHNWTRLWAKVGHCPNPTKVKFRVGGGRVLMAPQSSSTSPLLLTPGPGASLPPNLAEDPKVAHIPASNYTGYVVMYSTDKTMTLQYRSDNYQVQKAPCPQFKLQPGSPPERCLFTHLPGTNLDK